MKRKIFLWVLFGVIFCGGLFVVNKNIPKDEERRTVSYAEKVGVYVAPSAKMVEKFDSSGMGVATVGLANYQRAASTAGAQNFMSTNLITGA